MDLVVLAPRKRELGLTAPDVDGLARLFRVLSDTTRLKIVALLTKGEICVCELVEILNLPQSLVSNHLRVLRRAGLVRARRDDVDSRWVYYSLVPEAVMRLKDSCQSLFDLSDLSSLPALCSPGQSGPAER